MYYKVVFSGNNIFFENVSAQPDAGTPDPIIGFVSCRLIKADTEELAIAIAKRDLLVNWNQSFNADRRLGMPKLQLEHVAPISSWLKPRIHNDYYWFTDANHKQEHLGRFIYPRRWFWQRRRKNH